MKNIKYIFLYIISLMTLASCQTETNVIEPPTKIELTVKNESGQPQKNAVVALFDDYATFLIQNDIFGVKGATKVGKTDSLGFIKFDTLDPEKRYYVLAYTIDSTTFRDYQYKIHNDNSFTGFEFVRGLNKSSITRATITLKPAEALVSFFAENNNSGAVPIKIYLDNDSIGSIANTKPIDNVDINPASQKYRNDHLTELVRIGVEPTPIRFVNSIDCNNILRLNLEPGKFNKINVNRCTAGAVAFYTGEENNDILDIAVLLNGTNFIGNIDTTFARDPTNFLTAKTLNYVIDQPGVYTYTATAPGCIWMDSFTITSNSFTPVKLGRCN